MINTFRDYIEDSKLDLPESIRPPEASTKVEEIPKSEQVPGKVSEGPRTIAENIDYTDLYTKGDNIKKLNQSTPFIGSIVSSVEEIKDSWKQTRQNWSQTINGLKKVSENPQMAYSLVNMMLRAINGPEKVPPYNDDTQGEGILMKTLNAIGVGNLMSKLGIGNKKGEAHTLRDYLEQQGLLRESKGTFPSSPTISSVQSDGQGLTGQNTETKTIGDGTKQFVDSIVNIPLFSLGSDGSVTSPFLTEDYIGDENPITSWKEGEDIGPKYSDVILSAGEDSGSKGAAKVTVNYTELTSPYHNPRESKGPTDNVLYALETLNALHGYEPYSSFSPRNDSVWSMRIYPYSPGMDYRDSREENKAYYEGTLTPPLPITYIPLWRYNKDERGKEKFTCSVREFDWEKFTPVQSYDLMFGNLNTATADLANGGKLEFPESWNFNMRLQVSIIDDVDATFSKYMNYYFNRTYDKATNSRAPMEYSAFVADLIIFKAALKVNYQFKFIVVPVDFVPDMSGDSNSADTNSRVRIGFQIIGMVGYNNGRQSEMPTYEGDLAARKWNEVVILP